ncbi:transposase [Saliniramus fredricksonii]|uniref:transposase n=1 Tax=Saliniramus fredricksonii TaxID=1653334 RepID=UPI003B83697C
MEPLVPPARRGGRRRSVDIPAVLQGLLYVLEIGCRWRHLPRVFYAAQHGLGVFRYLAPRWHARSDSRDALSDAA